MLQCNKSFFLEKSGLRSAFAGSLVIKRTVNVQINRFLRTILPIYIRLVIITQNSVIYFLFLALFIILTYHFLNIRHLYQNKH